MSFCLSLSRIAGILGVALISGAPSFSWAAGDPALGEPIARRSCIACHDPDGPRPLEEAPRLSGQYAGYLVKQFRDFAEGRRQHVLMSPYLDTLAEGEIEHVAAFFARRPLEPDPRARLSEDDPAYALGRLLHLEGNAETGVPSCSGCHGDAAEGSRRFPRLAGQSAAYIVLELRQYAAGQRTNDRGLMQAVASRMTEAEMDAVARYLASLPQPADD